MLHHRSLPCPIGGTGCPTSGTECPTTGHTSLYSIIFSCESVLLKNLTTCPTVFLDTHTHHTDSRVGQVARNGVGAIEEAAAEVAVSPRAIHRDHIDARGARPPELSLEEESCEASGGPWVLLGTSAVRRVCAPAMGC
jgi:hypothetical protein